MLLADAFFTGERNGLALLFLFLVRKNRYLDLLRDYS